jgi:hypothetical protein
LIHKHTRIENIYKEDKTMPYIITTSYYPTDKIDEITKTFFEMFKKYPHDESLGEVVLLGTNIRTKKGVKAQGIVKVKKGKFEEITELIEKQLAMFRNVVGFESKTEIWQSLE